MLYERPLGDALTSAELSEEVIRTLVGSVGLVLAVPVTTLIAVLVVKATGIKGSSVKRVALGEPDWVGSEAGGSAAIGPDRGATDGVGPDGVWSDDAGAGPATRRGRRAALRG
jgi:hypothetical protein